MLSDIFYSLIAQYVSGGVLIFPSANVFLIDLIQPNAFDEAIKDIDGVAHVASPFHLQVRLHRTSEKQTMIGFLEN